MAKVTISISVLIAAPLARSIHEMRSGARDGCTYLRYILGTPFSLSFELLMTYSHNDMTFSFFVVHILMCDIIFITSTCKIKDSTPVCSYLSRSIVFTGANPGVLT